MIEFTPLRPGTIRDLFSGKRNMPVKAKGFDPLGLPSIPTQCVHVEIEELSEGIDFVRCVKDAESNGRHGWLCSEHNVDPFTPRRQEYRNKDQEIVDGIIAYEQRALRTADRETVVIGAKTKIQYVR